jgi:dihydrofolate reductase
MIINGMTFEVVVAYCVPSRGIGMKGTIPWRLPADLEHFYQITKGGVVIMGKNTWESIPISKRPLKDRINIVLTRHPEQLSGNPDAIYTSLSEALGYCSSDKKIFVIGGSKLYEESINHPNCCRIHITEIYKNVECDTFFPFIHLDQFQMSQISQIQEQNNLLYRFITFESKPKINPKTNPQTTAYC